MRGAAVIVTGDGAAPRTKSLTSKKPTPIAGRQRCSAQALTRTTSPIFIKPPTGSSSAHISKLTGIGENPVDAEGVRRLMILVDPILRRD
jgi:hypothetical protein